jgi:hypothetical protein
MIDLHTLTEKDVGRWVEYQCIGKTERGRIHSWNRHFVFVVYHAGDNWDLYWQYTGEATKPMDLIFVDEIPG